VQAIEFSPEFVDRLANVIADRVEQRIQASLASSLRPNAGNLLDADQVAKMFRVKPVTIYAWARRGILPCVRLHGNVVRFDAAEVAAWVESRKLSRVNTTAIAARLRSGQPATAPASLS